MKILILAEALDTQSAGIHRALDGMVSALHAFHSRHNWDVVLLRRKDDGRFPHFRTLTYPQWAFWPGMRFIRYFFLNPRSAKKVQAHAVFEPAHFGPFGLPRPIKRITFIHDLTPVLFPHLHPIASSFLQRLFLPAILRRADLILTNSFHTRKDIEAYQPSSKEKIRVIRFGFSSALVPRHDSSVLQKFGIRTPYFLSVGTIEPRKNYDFLVEAFNNYKIKTNSTIQLVIAGRHGWRTKKFDRALAASPYRKDIIVTGFIHDRDLEVLYAMCDLFIFPSSYEGFGLPVLEAMSAGVPCLVASNSSLIEIGGKQVQLFKSNDREDLWNKMAMKHSIKKPDPDWVKEKYGWEEFVREMESVRVQFSRNWNNSQD